MQIRKLLARRTGGIVAAGLLLASGLPVVAQQALTWDQAKAKFESANPVLKADAANVEEMKPKRSRPFCGPIPSSL